MLIAVGGTRGEGPPRPMVLLGLTQEDMEHLASGMPLDLELGTCGLPEMAVMIFHQPDREAMLAMFEPEIQAGVPVLTPVVTPEEMEEGREAVREGLRRLAEGGGRDAT
jgi:hypothetical protein